MGRKYEVEKKRRRGVGAKKQKFPKRRLKRDNFCAVHDDDDDDVRWPWPKSHFMRRRTYKTDIAGANIDTLFSISRCLAPKAPPHTLQPSAVRSSLLAVFVVHSLPSSRSLSRSLPYFFLYFLFLPLWEPRYLFPFGFDSVLRRRRGRGLTGVKDDVGRSLSVSLSHSGRGRAEAREKGGGAAIPPAKQKNQKKRRGKRVKLYASIHRSTNF